MSEVPKIPSSNQTIPKWLARTALISLLTGSGFYASQTMDCSEDNPQEIKVNEPLSTPSPQLMPPPASTPFDVSKRIKEKDVVEPSTELSQVSNQIDKIATHSLREFGSNIQKEYRTPKEYAELIQNTVVRDLESELGLQPGSMGSGVSVAIYPFTKDYTKWSIPPYEIDGKPFGIEVTIRFNYKGKKEELTVRQKEMYLLMGY